MSTFELPPVLPPDLPWLRALVAEAVLDLQRGIRAARRRRQPDVEGAFHQEVADEYRRLVRWNQGLVEVGGRWRKGPCVPAGEP